MPKEFPGASFDNWLTTNPADMELISDDQEPEPETYPCWRCGEREPMNHRNEKRRLDEASGEKHTIMLCDKCIADLEDGAGEVEPDGTAMVVFEDGGTEYIGRFEPFDPTKAKGETE